MRRISLALALVGAVAAAGCGVGSNNSPASGTNKGTPGSTYTLSVNPGNTVAGGKVQSGSLSGGVFTPDGKINCGTVAGVTNTLCQADYAWGTTGLALLATPDTGNSYYAFAGDCFGGNTTGGTYYCQLGGNADKMVLVRFASSITAIGTHPNFSDPAQHGPMAFQLNCTQCHGSSLQGQGIAPACSLCHTAAHIQAQLKTGLNVAINSVSTTNPVTVQFTLKDNAGNNVDPTGLNSGAGFSANQNRPMSITMALTYFTTDTAGNFLGYVSSTAGSPGTTTAWTTISNNTITSGTIPTATTTQYAAGTLTKGGTACTIAAPCTCSTGSPCTYSGTAGTQAGRACTVANPCTCTSANPCAGPLATAAGQNTLQFNAATGVYTYTFASTTAITTNASLPNATLWIATTRQEDLTNANDTAFLTAVNTDYNFRVFDANAPIARRIVDPSTCTRCHDGFQPEATVDANGVATSISTFHGAGRNNPAYCNICHYTGASPGGSGNGPTGSKDSAQFVHRIHAAEQLGFAASQEWHNITVSYPQDVGNCKQCHPNTAQGNQYKTHPLRSACGACHVTVNFATGANHNPNGLNSVPANLAQADDSACASCHTPAEIDTDHTPVMSPDPYNSYVALAVTTGTAGRGYTQGSGASLVYCTTAAPCTCGNTSATQCNNAGANANTNAAYLAAAGAQPAGAHVISWNVVSASRNSSKNPVISFQILQDGSPVTFNACGTNSSSYQLVSNFVGSPSVYFVWAVPQDGVLTPADFNAAASAYVKDVCNKNALAASTTHITNSGSTYTIVFDGQTAGTTATGTRADGMVCSNTSVCTCSASTPCSAVIVPDNATMLTAGVGYTYSLTSTQPLTEIDLAAYPYNASNKTGGLVIPAPNVSQVASGYAARRTVVTSTRCDNCHAQLGVQPTFHAGQRNDAGSCNWCHNPNKTSSGWAANEKDFIHAIHGNGKRSVPFNWHAACSPGSKPDPTNTVCWDVDSLTTVAFGDPYFPGVEFPGSKCLDCHEPGTYDGSAASFTAAKGSLLPSTAATGTFTASTSNSPYVNTTSNYGTGFAVTNATGVAVQATSATLANSPIAAACFGCHTSTTATTHITTMGGVMYQPRAQAVAAVENCFACHGKGGVVDVNNVH